MSQWFIAVGSEWVGPFSSAEVISKITTNEVSWVDYVWKKGQSNWQRICDVSEFKQATPQAPKKAIIEDIKGTGKISNKGKAPPPPIQEKIWFLYYNDSQFGPFSEREVIGFLKVGKIHGKVHAWKDGMTQWERIETLDPFIDASEDAAKIFQKKKASLAQPAGSASLGTAAVDQRKAPRQPLVAKILMTQQDRVIAGLCRDISVGGMQVLTDHVPGPAGTRIKLNVTPLGQQQGIQPFVAEGVIVRVLEDGRGFSFRFEKLTESSRRIIENYIHPT